MSSDATPDWQLARNPFGRLVMTTADGVEHLVTPVRAFPIAAPEESISIVDGEGHELAWIDKLAELPPPLRDLVAGELGSREFTPEIRRIRSVSSFAVPSEWDVETDRGDTRLMLKGEEFIRRLSSNTLMIGDASGVSFLIRDLAALDRPSRKLLDRFL